jgi:isoleucyl-tRNA synthetase
MAHFKSPDADVSFPRSEEELLALWSKQNTFRRSVEERPADQAYIFYDGPPFATGLPHYGHFVASTIKDIVPRYWTMRGHRVERRFGWDTHGLPIEMDVEKKLNLSGPRSIREYGVDKFNEACRAGVLKYVTEWEKTITRLGRWVDFENDYKTMDASFMESIWWVFSQLWEKGLIYRGLRVTPFSWRLSTPLSNFEAGLDYRDVDDPALTVKLALTGKTDEFLLIWTTTPWTLPSNLAVAVGADVDYVKVEHEGHRYWLARERLVPVLGEGVTVLEEKKGAGLVGLTYTPLFPYFAKHPGAFRVIASDHVTTGDGTGLVHMAPAFGEEDFNACRREGIEPVDPVDDEGNFTAQVPDWAGRNVKEADKDIIKELKSRHLVLRHDTIRHSYPYCWRSGTPLIYKTTPSWYVRVESIRERMVKNNASVHWVPEFVGQARFANWLKDARDWSISRSRFWGTPLPVWVSEDGSEQVCIGSVAQLEELTGQKVPDLHPHRIDHLTFQKNGKTFKRVGDVFDCWFESGAMPYAQAHYPFENKAAFEQGFPAKFIAEGLDQTRGWFYTLMVLSTALFDKSPFENVIVNGLVLAEDGEKMSKSKQNYPDPWKVLNELGADALRAYLISSPVVRAEPLRFSETGVKDVIRTVMLPLQNALNFFVTYANVEHHGQGWDPKVELAKAPPVAQRGELDRWLLSVLQSLVREVNGQMEGYYLYKVVPPMLAFIDDLTNWYIRRSRRRFWRSESDTDKLSAYATLYEVLVTFAKVLAPVMPFMSERIYQSLVVDAGVKGADASVHLERYPQVDASKIDAELEAAIAAVRTVVTSGRVLREKHKLKTRQPLRSVTVVSHDDAVRARLEKHADLVAEELNVKQVIVVKDDASLATLSFRPNFKTLGKKLGPKLKTVGKALEALSRADWATLENGGTLTIDEAVIAKEDVLVTRTASGSVVLESSGDITVALDTALDEALKREGLLREALRAIQQARQATEGLQVSHRIHLVVTTGNAELVSVLREFEASVRDEALVTGDFHVVADASAVATTGYVSHQGDVEGEHLTIAVRAVTV